MTTEPSPLSDPSAIMALATGYWNSAAFLAAMELDLFTRVGEAGLGAPAVAAELGAPLRGVVALLDACVALGLLIKEGAPGHCLYRCAPEAAAFLISGRPGSLVGAIRWGAGQYPLWGNLAEAVRTDRPAAPPSQHLGSDPEQTRRFVLGMHSRALGVARGVIRYLDMNGVTRLLDVGGGPGTYSVLLARQHPALHCVVMDLPAVTDIAAELITEAGLSDRVTVKPGSAVSDAFGHDEYDAVLFSGVLHQMAPETIRSMFARAASALRPGGRLFVSDIMSSQYKTSPLFSTLFSLQMLLTSEEGAVFSGAECARWLEEAGFADISIREMAPPLPYMLVEGRRAE